MRELLADLRGTIVELIVLIAAGYYVYTKLRGDAITLTAALPSAAKEAESIRNIVSSAPSVLTSILRGESDQGYITREQQAALSVQRLAEKNAKNAAIAVTGA